ncbi:uncharacterized protein LOC117218014 isoform X3 [Megalopta genalis]
MLAARAQAIARLKESPAHSHLDETALLGKLMAYCSRESHSSVEKDAMICFVKLRILEPDEKSVLRGETLRQAIEADTAEGYIPFFVSTTLGTTACCSFDNLKEIGPVCKKYHGVKDDRLIRVYLYGSRDLAPLRYLSFRFVSSGLVARGRGVRRQRFHLPGIEASDGRYRVHGLLQHEHQQVPVDELRLLLPVGEGQVQADQRARRRSALSSAHSRRHGHRLQALEHTSEPTISLPEAVVRPEKLRNIWITGLHPQSYSVGEKVRGAGQKGREVRGVQRSGVGIGVLSGQGQRQAEPEAAEHDKRLGEAAHGPGASQPTLHDPLRARRAECHRFRRRHRLEHHNRLSDRVARVEGRYGRAGGHPREEEESHSGAEKVLLRSHGVRSCDPTGIHQNAEQNRSEARRASDDRRHRLESSFHLTVLDILATGLPHAGEGRRRYQRIVPQIPSPGHDGAAEGRQHRKSPRQQQRLQPGALAVRFAVARKVAERENVNRSRAVCLRFRTGLQVHRPVAKLEIPPERTLFPEKIFQYRGNSPFLGDPVIFVDRSVSVKIERRPPGSRIGPTSDRKLTDVHRSSMVDLRSFSEPKPGEACDAR